MPSHRFYPMSSRSHIFMKHSNVVTGGAVALLLNKIVKDPSETLGGQGLSANKIVGITSPPPSKPDTSKTVQTAFKGGELLNGLRFTHKKGDHHKGHQDNIKFLF